MKADNTDFFWPSYTDLMTSLFFIMLVLYVLTYIRLNSTIKLQKEKLAIIEAVEENLKPLKTETSLFRYEEQYKRFTLAFDVNFKISEYEMQSGKLDNYSSASVNISIAGKKLQKVIDNLAQQKQTNPALKNVSYLVIVSGYASHLLNGNELDDYLLSYKRAYFLRQYWKRNGIDFEDNKYKDLIDLQVSGNGWGGIGRFTRDSTNYFLNETKNQRFIIQVVPKIGDIK